jgi:hypothetical protein
MVVTTWRLTGFALQIIAWLWREHRKAVYLALVALIAIGGVGTYVRTNTPPVSCYEPPAFTSADGRPIQPLTRCAGPFPAEARFEAPWGAECHVTIEPSDANPAGVFGVVDPSYCAVPGATGSYRCYRYGYTDASGQRQYWEPYQSYVACPALIERTP